jgi:hypothetical protein
MGKGNERQRRQPSTAGRGIVPPDPEAVPSLPNQSQDPGVRIDWLDEADLRPRANAEFFRDLARERQAKRLIHASVCMGEVPAFLVGPVRPGERGGFGNGEAGQGAAGMADPVDVLWARGGPQSSKRVGLNHMKAYRVNPSGVAATKYGPEGAQVADAQALGAGLTRQLGGRDLLLPFLIPGSSSLAAAPIPVLGSPPSLADESTRATELDELIDDARAGGVRLSFTFWNIGADPHPVPHTADAYEGVDYFHSLGGSELITTSCEQDEWTDGHVGQVDHESPPAYFPRGVGSWHLQTLDASSPYKRAYLKYFAECAARVLEMATGNPATGALESPYHDVVESIELFNEVELTSTYYTGGSTGSYDPATTGEIWGRACAWAAAGFRDSLRDPEVRIGLPGILSHDRRNTSATDRFSWSARLDHLQGLIAGMTHELLDTSALGRLGKTADTLGEYIQGIDLHYYHDEPDLIRHVGYLPLEVAEIFDAVGDGLADGLYQAGFTYPSAFSDYGQPVLDAFRVTVMENGCSGDSRGRSHCPAEFASQEDFQAFEVWRRVGAALASRAESAGWHSWMAGQLDPRSPEFGGFGLRQDTGADSDPASNAVQRPSWFSFHRLSHALGDVVSGRMLLPSVAGTSQLAAFLQSDARHPAVVFEYQRSTVLLPYAYLAFADPMEPADVTSALLWFSSPGSVWRLDVSPSQYMRSIHSSLPTNIPLYRPSVPVPSSSLLLLRRGDLPILLYASAPITWSTLHRSAGVMPGLLGDGSACSAGRSGCGDFLPTENGQQLVDVLRSLYLVRPAWMDDPALPIQPVPRAARARRRRP